MKEYTQDEWFQEAVGLFGKDKKDWKFKCSNCGHVQSIKDFEAAKIDEPESKVFFSCIGRWINSEGTLGNNKAPCNYTLGGLLNFAKSKVKTEDGKFHSVFEFAEPENSAKPKDQSTGAQLPEQR